MSTQPGISDLNGRGNGQVPGKGFDMNMLGREEGGRVHVITE